MGKYGPEEHNGKRTFPVSSIIGGLGLIINLVSSISVYIQRRKLENSDANTTVNVGIMFPNKIPKSLESLLANCFIMFWIVIHGVASFAFK